VEMTSSCAFQLEMFVNPTFKILKMSLSTN